MEWQPIETAPKDGTLIILWNSTKGLNRAYFGSWRVDSSEEHLEDSSLANWFDDSYDDFSLGYSSLPLNPTHWMPLPPPPSKPIG